MTVSEGNEPVNLDIDPAEAQWEEMKAHPVIGEFIRNFRIPSVDEDP
jgi:hypothetical protein